MVMDDQFQEDYIPLVIPMQGHLAPLGVNFFEWRDALQPDCGTFSFSETMDRYAFIAFHGSWNCDLPMNYKVVYAPIDSNDDAICNTLDLLAHEAPNAKLEDGFLPVHVDLCWTNIVSTQLLLGICSLKILLAHSIAVNTSSITIGYYIPRHTSPHCIIFCLFGESEKIPLSSAIH
jgi:hypothetical protein